MTHQTVDRHRLIRHNRPCLKVGALTPGRCNRSGSREHFNTNQHTRANGNYCAIDREA